jgi:hypothetical protein
MNPTALFDQPVTDRDWQVRAWGMLKEPRASNPGWTVDDALAHPVIGRIVRAMGHHLRHRAQADADQQQREKRFGRKVEFNGYGYRPVRRA